MPILEWLPELVRGASVRAWDLASSTAGDWTVGLKLSLRKEDRLPIITDVQRMRGRPDEVRRLVKTIADADTRETKIMLPQDPAQAGADQVQSYIEMLSGFRVEAVRMSGSKELRADAVASQCNIGRIGMVKARWNPALIDELGRFPLGPHDDLVQSFDGLDSALDLGLQLLVGLAEVLVANPQIGAGQALVAIGQGGLGGEQRSGVIARHEPSHHHQAHDRVWLELS